MKDALRLGIVVALAVAASAQAAAAPTKYALLVGCTKYDHLDPAHHLEGPANDVLLVRDVLKKYYDLQDKNLVILSEAAGKERGAQYRPTRANIRREFAELARKATLGDKVVILLAGHGSQQPDSKPDDPERFEPDGKEEIFLPADCGEWDGSRVKNAIVDYEFRDWLKGIRTTGASLWVIVDACHSSSILRSPTEKPREVTADKLVPEAVLRQAEDKARQRQEGREAKKKQRTFKLPPQEPDLVAIYAAQSTEPTVELILPEEGGDRKPRGLLTYTLCKVLVEAREAKAPLTYQQLLQRIHDHYKDWDRKYPTPLIEGKDRNRQILGEVLRGGGDVGDARIALVQDGPGDWFLDQGSLHGLTVGSVLKVYPPAGGVDSEQSVGHVEILEDDFGALRARVKPCVFAKTPAPKELPKRGRCELVFVNYGEQRLAVAVDPRTLKDEELSNDKSQSLLDMLKKLEKEEGSLIKFVPPADARWLLRFDSRQSNKLYLMPAGLSLPDGSGKAPAQVGATPSLPPLFGPVPVGREDWLRERLARIARVRNLLAIANRPARARRDSPFDVKCKLEVVRFRNELDETGVPVARGPEGIAFHDRDKLGIVVTNEGREPIDISVLQLDNEYGINAIFPKVANTDNRVQPNQIISVGVNMRNKTRGQEHLLVVAVKGESVREYAQFSFLAQPSIESVTREMAAVPRGTAKKSLESPLGKLLLGAAFGRGRQRGVEMPAAKEFAFQLFSYDALPTRRPAEKK